MNNCVSLSLGEKILSANFVDKNNREIDIEEKDKLPKYITFNSLLFLAGITKIIPYEMLYILSDDELSNMDKYISQAVNMEMLNINGGLIFDKDGTFRFCCPENNIVFRWVSEDRTEIIKENISFTLLINFVDKIAYVSDFNKKIHKKIYLKNLYQNDKIKVNYFVLYDKLNKII